ncbi:MAG: T9SS type A sorting domain-containing protein, partial [Flammeovirgaceae bacterium]
TFTITLIDRFSNNEVNIANTNIYSFNVTSDARSFQNRFEIRFDVAAGGNVVTSFEPNRVLSAYPNPTTSNVVIDLNSNEVSSVTLFNPLGQAIMQFETSQPSIQLEMAHLPAGIYILRVRSAAGFEDMRISKL